MIAARFQGFSFMAFRKALGEGFSGFLIALAVAATGAAIASKLTGLPFVLTLLAFSPGGVLVATMELVAPERARCQGLAAGPRVPRDRDAHGSRRAGAQIALRQQQTVRLLGARLTLLNRHAEYRADVGIREQRA